VRGSYSYIGANDLDPVGLETGNGGFALELDYAYKFLGFLGPTNFFSFTLGW
jgi:hypothetical protein